MLGYISNETSRYHTFVANRAHQIRSLTNIDDWYYCQTEYNYADYAGRGLDARNLKDHDVWFKCFLIGIN